jgi:hypothetical protein
VERLRQNLEWVLGGVTLLAIAAFFSYLAFLVVRDLWSWSLSVWLRGLGSLLVLAILLLGGLLFAYVLTRVFTWLRPTADEGSLFLVLLVIYVLGGGEFLGYDPRAHSHPLWTDLGVLIGGGMEALILGGLLWLALDRPGRGFLSHWRRGIARDAEIR